MSRLDGRPVEVTCDTAGRPEVFTITGESCSLTVRAVFDHWREWIGALDGEPERDVWQVETVRGVCELHHLRHPTEGADEPAAVRDPEHNGGRVRWEDLEAHAVGLVCLSGTPEHGHVACLLRQRRYREAAAVARRHRDLFWTRELRRRGDAHAAGRGATTVEPAAATGRPPGRACRRHQSRAARHQDGTGRAARGRGDPASQLGRQLGRSRVAARSQGHIKRRGLLETGRIRVRPDALSPIHALDCFHVVLGEHKIEQGDVFPDALRRD